MTRISIKAEIEDIKDRLAKLETKFDLVLGSSLPDDDDSWMERLDSRMKFLLERGLMTKEQARQALREESDEFKSW